MCTLSTIIGHVLLKKPELMRFWFIKVLKWGHAQIENQEKHSSSVYLRDPSLISTSSWSVFVAHYRRLWYVCVAAHLAFNYVVGFSKYRIPPTKVPRTPAAHTLSKKKEVAEHDRLQVLERKGPPVTQTRSTERIWTQQLFFNKIGIYENFQKALFKLSDSLS